MDEQALIDQLYEGFISATLDQKKVWGLKDEDGWAISPSEDGEDEVVFPFWSSKQGAAALAANEWTGYKPEAMQLAHFLESWCLAEENQNVLVGIDLDAQMDGLAVDPVELCIDLTSEMIAREMEMEFREFKNLHQLHAAAEAKLEA